jgi:hypothetical protein
MALVLGQQQNLLHNSPESDQKGSLATLAKLDEPHRKGPEGTGQKEKLDERGGSHGWLLNLHRQLLRQNSKVASHVVVISSDAGLTWISRLE